MSSPPKNLLSYLRVIVAAWRDDPRDDAELLAHFVEVRDEAAFATLVGRHGPLVWRTCRSLLGDTPDAEDAFQATFLALARKAGRFPVESLAGWLHRVARQVALDARAGAQRRRGLEQRLRAVAQPKTEEDASRAELYAALDEELVGLPEKLRVPLLLHHLEGRSQVEVARLLGCARSVVQYRLARGEAILRERLERRGLTEGIGPVITLLGSTATAPALQARLIGRTAQAAIAFRFGTCPGGVAEGARATLRSVSFPLKSSTSAALAEGVMKTMLVTKLKLVVVLLGMTLCLAGGGMLAYQALAGNAAESPQPDGEARREAEASPQPGAAARVDCYGDSLPTHAVARMGTTRLWRGTNSSILANSSTFAFSPDGKALATHIDGMTICLWDAATGKEIRRLTTKAVKGRIAALGFSLDGKTLVAVDGWDRTVCKWEVATGKFLCKQEYQGPKRDKVQDLKVAFLPDGQIRSFGNFLKSVEKGEGMRGAYVWDVATGKEICQLSRPLKRTLCENTTFSLDGKLLVTTTHYDQKANKTIISLWDITTGKEIRQLTHEGEKNGGVGAVALSPDGKTLASGDFQKICVWEVATGKLIHLFPRLQEAAQANGALDHPLTYSPDGKTLVGGRAGHLWDVGTGKEIRSLGCKDAQVALFSPDGNVLAMGDGAGAIRLWEVATGKEIGPRKAYRGGIRSVAYSPDGKTLASMGKDETVRLWEAATGKEMRPLAKHTWWGSNSIAYSPDGKMLVSMDDVIHLWDTATGKEIRQFGESGGPPKSACFSPDGKIVAAIMNDQMLCLWEVATGKEIYSRPAACELYNTCRFVPLAFSPDGRLLATPGKEENTVSLWEVATGKLIDQLSGLNNGLAGGRVRFLVFSPDGRMLATSSISDDKICLWEVASDKQIGQLTVFNRRKMESENESWKRGGYVLAFSPDGRILSVAAVATQELDGSNYFDPKVHLLEIASGKELGQLTGHQASIRALAFSPDGKTLASGSNDLTCLIWDVTSVGRLKPMPALPLPKEWLEAAWADLAKDPAKAYGTIRVLQATPTQAIALLQARVRPVVPLTNPQQLKRWIVDLDDSNFAVREKVQQKIKKLGELALPALRQALKGQPSLEVKRRLQALLAELEPKLVSASPERLRELRAVQVLEYIGTAEARQVLQAWAKGVAEARLTQEANAALARLAKRSAARS